MKVGIFGAAGGFACRKRCKAGDGRRYRLPHPELYKSQVPDIPE
jgi:hypothetical protein